MTKFKLDWKLHNYLSIYLSKNVFFFPTVPLTSPTILMSSYQIPSLANHSDLNVHFPLPNVRTWRPSWLSSPGKPTLGCEHRCPMVQACKHNEAMKMQTRTSEKPFLLKASHNDLPYSSSNPHNPTSRYLCLFTISFPISPFWKIKISALLPGVRLAN